LKNYPAAAGLAGLGFTILGGIGRLQKQFHQLVRGLFILAHLFAFDGEHGNGFTNGGPLMRGLLALQLPGLVRHGLCFLCQGTEFLGQAFQFHPLGL